MFVFNNRKFELEIKHYSNNRVALMLNEEDPDIGFFTPYDKLTVNLPEVELAEDEVIVNFNANNAESSIEREVLEIISATKIATPVKPYRFVDSGFNSYPVFKLRWDKINAII